MGDSSSFDRAVAAAGQGNQDRPGATQSCPYASCSSLWASINSDTAKIAAIEDPIDRNREVSAKYAQLYQADPRLQWVGLAAVVSRQAGCAMQEAKAASDSWLPFKAQPAKAAYEGLGAANKAIFSDIYPVAKFYQTNGLAQLKRCASDGSQDGPVPEKLVKAFEQFDTGTPEGIRRGSDILANYEQRDVVQDQIYANEEYRKAFERNEYWSKNFVGRAFGARPAELPLSSKCGEGGGSPVPFEGSITDPDARVRYYGSLMDKFSGQNEQWRQQTMKEIAN